MCVAMMSQSECDDIINVVQMRREHDDVMPMSSPCDANYDDVVFLQHKH